MINQPGQGFAAVDRIHDNPLRSRQKLQGFPACLTDHPIALADIVVMAVDVIGANLNIQSQQTGRGIGNSPLYRCSLAYSIGSA